jgi:hypothetical protein
MSRNKSGIYVEIAIRGDLDHIWLHTQDPALHERWDLRFSTIRYLPRTSPSEPQRFLYATRIGFGARIEGAGESTGSREDGSGACNSGLKFWSDDAKSLIREGAGYWRYLPGDGTGEGANRFLTWYDYRTRFGLAGRIFDRLVFRRLIGWATAWSFDRLRLWIEDGVSPSASLRFAAIHAVVRGAIAFIWIWQGLVPKLLFANAGERSMLRESGLPVELLPAIGALEILAGLAAVGFWGWRPYFILNALAMVAALASVAMNSPTYLAEAFNPLTLNLGMMALSVAGYMAAAQMPSASRCRRSPKEEG